MPGKTRGKSREPKELQYGALTALTFDNIALSAASPASNTVQAALPLASTFKIFRIETVVFGTVTNATSFDIQYGTGNYASTTVAADDTFDTTGQVNLAANNTTVMGGLQALSTTTGTVQSWNPSVPEAMYGAGGALTLRLNGTTVTANVKVVVYGKFVDANQLDPQAQTTAGGAPHTFNAGTDPL